MEKLLLQKRKILADKELELVRLKQTIERIVRDEERTKNESVEDYEKIKNLSSAAHKRINDKIVCVNDEISILKDEISIIDKSLSIMHSSNKSE